MPAKNKALLLVAAGASVAIAIGAWLYLDKRAAEPVGAAEAELLVDQNFSNLELMQQALDAQIEGLQEDSRARLDSPTGQALMTRCLEWQQFHADHPDAMTERNRDAACGEYRRYVTSGELPDPDD